jgi:hypothetical protein
LLERAGALELLARELDAVVDSGRGRVVLVAGEAGIGKSALVGAFCVGLRSLPVMRGACDALLTPRPLGPLVDIGEQIGGELADLVEGGASASDLLGAIAVELRRRVASVVVLEDCIGPMRPLWMLSVCWDDGSRRYRYSWSRPIATTNSIARTRCESSLVSCLERTSGVCRWRRCLSRRWQGWRAPAASTPMRFIKRLAGTHSS